MKKLISILLVLACMLVMASCDMGGGGTQPPAETQGVLDVLAQKIKDSSPAKSVVTTEVGNADISLTSKETTQKGTLIDGSDASVWEREYETLNDLGAGTDVKKIVTEKEEFVAGMIRTNGGKWESYPTNPVRQIRPYRINLDASLIRDLAVTENETVYAFVIPQANVASVLTDMDADAIAAIQSDVSVVIEVKNAGMVTGISFSYKMKNVSVDASTTLENCNVTLVAEYSYDLPILSIDR